MTQIRLFAGAKAAAGTDTHITNASTLTSALDELVSAYPALSTILPSCSFLIDGARVTAPDDRPITASTVLDVLPPFAGG